MKNYLIMSTFSLQGEIVEVGDTVSAEKLTADGTTIEYYATRGMIDEITDGKGKKGKGKKDPAPTDGDGKKDNAPEFTAPENETDGNGEVVND